MTSVHELSREERSELRGIVGQCLADLQAEIAGTNSPELREFVQRRERLLTKLLYSLA